jgi:NitT/TauT family transport system substrate-binding protein
MLNEIRGLTEARVVFDSSMTPGEILDLTLVRTDVLEENPELGKALVGAWYETMRVIQDGETRDGALAHMAAASGTDVAGYARQLETTYLFADAAEAVNFVTSDAPRTTMQRVAEFSFEHGLLGPMAPDAGFVGIEFADDSVWGSTANVNLRFTDEYMRMAAEGEL